MDREQDRRARRPPAGETLPDGLDSASESIDGIDSGGLDLRAGLHKLELGRNPRGGPTSVNETIKRYKEAQARKFAEHGADNRRETPVADSGVNGSPYMTDSFKPQDAPGPVRSDTLQSQDFTENREPLRTKSSASGDVPFVNQPSESRAVPQHKEQPFLSFREEIANQRNKQGSYRQRFDEPQTGRQETEGTATDVTGAEVPSDSPVISEQPVLMDSEPAPIPPVRNTLSHERAPRSKQERQGQLQHSRSHLPDDPRDAAPKRNTQRDSERFIKSDDAAPAHSVTPAVADSYIRGAEYDHLRTKTEGKLRFTDGDPAQTAETVTGAEVLPDFSVIPEHLLLEDAAPSPAPPARNTLSHERVPRSVQKRQERLQHSRLPGDLKDTKQKRNTQRDSERFIKSVDVAPAHTIAPAASDVLNKSAGISNPAADSVIRGAEYDPLRIKTEGKLQFTDDDPALPADPDVITEPELPVDEPFTEEQPPEEALTEEAKTPARDTSLSHERNSGINHDPPSRLQYDRAPVAPSTPLRHKAAYRAAAAAVFAGEKKIPEDVATDTTAPKPVTESGADWRRAADPADPIASTTVDAPAAPSVTGTPPTASGKPTTGHSPKPAKDGRGSDAGSNSRKKKHGKLKFEDETDTPVRTKSGRKLDKARHKADRSSGKLTKAREKLPTKRVLRMNREFDAEKGKLKPRLRFEEEVKTPKEHLKGSPVTRPLKASAGAVVGYAHTKMHQAENDNVAVKAAHRGEMIAEQGARSIYRYAKNTPYRRVQKLQKQMTKLDVKADYKQILHDNPGIKNNPVARAMQKRQIKKNYAKAARDAQRAGQKTVIAAKKASAAAAKAGAKVKAVASNPKVLLIIGILFLIVVLLFGFISSCSSMATSVGGYITATSYLAEDDADIDDAELYYTELETDLAIRISNTETEFSGYDEYRYNVGDISHNPFELMAFLTAVYQNFTFTDIQPVLAAVFAEQYTLTHTPSVEIRTRTVTRTGSYTDPDTGETISYSYEEEEEYEWHILTVTLTSRPFTGVVYTRMDADQRQHYSLLMQSKGNRQYAQSPFDFNWLPFVSSYYGYRVHPITGVKDYHLGIDIAAPAGTEILSAQTGTVTFAGDLGGYGLVVVIEDSNGLVTKYAHCATLLVSAGQTVTVGDPIATVGSTGSSTGPHLHFEVLKDGRYLNPIYFALTNDDGSGSVPPGMPGGVIIPPYSGEPMGDGSYAALIHEAEKFLGYPYVWGGSSPSTSFDCSGFVSWVLTQSGVKNTGRLTAQGLFNICTPVSAANAQPGDLIFFHSTYSAPYPVTHVGIYVGGSPPLMIHCGNPISYAPINTTYWQDHFYAFGRLSD